MGNVKSRYLRYAVSGDQFCGWEVSDLNPLTYNFDSSCSYFETMYEMNTQLENYILETVALGYALSN